MNNEKDEVAAAYLKEYVEKRVCGDTELHLAIAVHQGSLQGDFNMVTEARTVYSRI